MSVRGKLNRLEALVEGQDGEGGGRDDWIADLSDAELDRQVDAAIRGLLDSGDLQLGPDGFEVPEGVENADLLARMAEILNQGLERGRMA